MKVSPHLASLFLLLCLTLASSLGSPDDDVEAFEVDREKEVKAPPPAVPEERHGGEAIMEKREEGETAGGANERGGQVASAEDEVTPKPAVEEKKMKKKVSGPLPRLSASDSRPKIAIIGAGIGGTSCAYFLRQLFSSSARSNDWKDGEQERMNITLFEMGPVGGRLATIKMAGYEYEVGGSIIHPANKLMKDLVKATNLTVRDEPTYVNGWRRDQFTMYSFGENVFKTSTYSVFAYFQMIFRYGILVLYRTMSFVKGVIDNFKYIYSYLESEQYVDNVSDLLARMSPTGMIVERSLALNDTDIGFNIKLSEEGAHKQFVDELVTAAVKTNYGQFPDSVHAFVGEVALAGAEGDLWSVKEGNKKVPERLVTLTRAHLAHAQVSSVTLKDSGKFTVAFKKILTTDSETSSWLFREGGASSPAAYKPHTSGKEQVEDFDVVIVATPLTSDKSIIKIKGLSYVPQFPGSYHRTVATLVHGEINPKFFGCPTLADMTAVNFFVDKLSNINSVDLLVPVDLSKDVSMDSLPMVWKIFSQTPLTDDELGEMFLSRSATTVVDWLAYPHYRTQQRDSLGNFTLHPGLYYINSVEFAASAMEMSAVGAKNVANAVKHLWIERRSGLNDEMEEEEEKENSFFSWWKTEL